MKKVLMTLIVSLAFWGSVFAQPESHYPGFDYHDFFLNNGLIAQVQIDGVFITGDDNYEYFEVCPFVGEEQRGVHDENPGFMAYYPEDGDPYPIVEFGIYYDSPGEPVSFKMYDHINQIEYVLCTTIIDSYTGEPIEMVTGSYYGSYEYPVILNFSMTVEKKIACYTGDSDYWYLISSPVGTVDPTNVMNMLSNTYDLYYFDQTASDGLEWINRKINATGEINDFDLVAGIGYLYANSGGSGENNDSIKLTFIGTPNTENVTVELVKANGVYWSGWNLIGNPFNVNYTMDRDFLVMNEDGTEFITPDERTWLMPMEGAFIFANEDDGGEFVFTYPDPNSGSGTGGGMGGGGEFSINIGHGHGQGHGVIDRAIVRFGEGRTLPKLQLNPNHTKVYIPQEGTDYTVVRASEMGEIPVNFKAEKNGAYTLNINSKSVNFAYLHLIDNLTGNDVDLLATPVYTFDARNTDYASRFKLVFATSDSNDENFAFFNNGNLIINNDGEATLQVVDVMGRILSSETVSGNCSKHINAAKGVYMIRLINGSDVKVQKIVVE